MDKQHNQPELDNQADGHKGESFPAPELDGYLAEDEDPLQRELSLAAARASRRNLDLLGAAIGITVTDLD